MGKNRVQIPLPVKRSLLIECGYKCSVTHCEAEASLEFHHIDNNPTNNDPENIIVFCANHHAQATKGSIRRLDCLDMKKLLKNKGTNIIDHKKLAQLIAENLVSSEGWPINMDSSCSLKELANGIFNIIGVKVELIIKLKERLIVWIKAVPNEFKQAKALVLAAACMVGGVKEVKYIEIGLTDSFNFVRTTGGNGVGKLRVLFTKDQVNSVAGNQTLPISFWKNVKVLIVDGENTPFMRTFEIPINEFESRVKW